MVGNQTFSALILISDNVNADYQVQEFNESFVSSIEVGDIAKDQIIGSKETIDGYIENVDNMRNSAGERGSVSLVFENNTAYADSVNIQNTSTGETENYTLDQRVDVADNEAVQKATEEITEIKDSMPQETQTSTEVVVDSAVFGENNSIKYGSKEFWNKFYKTIDDTIATLANRYENDLMIETGTDPNNKEAVDFIKAEAYLRAKADVYDVDLPQKMLNGEIKDPFEVTEQIYTAKASGDLMAKANPYNRKEPVVPENYTGTKGQVPRPFTGTKGQVPRPFMVQYKGVIIVPRYSRKKSNSGIFHIMFRGINQQVIFEEDEDKERFIKTLERFKTVSKYKIYGYCLMNNHVHILLKEKEEEISAAIKRICSSYVYWYNQKYARCGHLFQERYKSEAVENDAYLLTVLRYIHQNPIKAGLSRSVQDYKWSSYNEYIEGSRITDITFVLEIFSGNRERAINLFIEHANEENIDKCLDNEEKIRLSDNEVKEYFAKLGFQSSSEIQHLERNKRNEIIKKLKTIDGVTIRQLSRITGISKSAIDRI